MGRQLIGRVQHILSRLGVGRTEKQAPIHDGFSIRAADTLKIPTDESSDTCAMLRDLMWDAGEFDVTSRTIGSHSDATLRFASPRPLGHSVSDTVYLDWHAARSPDGRLIDAPAVLVLDILQGGNLVSNFIGKHFARRGFHGFSMHMPFTGQRRDPREKYDWRYFLPSLRQSIADARRARDVIACLPRVVGGVRVQGTSLGGFVATVTAALDGAFTSNIITLAGGDLYRILSEGHADAAKVRQQLRTVGFNDRALRDELWRSEPLRVAHRLNPDHTWLLTARQDQVVFPRFSRKLADRAHLPRPHHRLFAGCHYTCLISAPWILGAMVQGAGS